MKSNKVGQDERALRLANGLRRHINKEAGRLKAEITAELRHTDETKRARKAVVAVGARLDQVISTLEARRSAFCAIARPAAESRQDV
jgi:glycine/D-amino acid oxidase-like deaminating enzyme